MLIKLADWERIREQFSDDDKAKLNAAVTGEVICPRGMIINTGKLPLALTVKLSQALAGKGLAQAAGGGPEAA